MSLHLVASWLHLLAVLAMLVTARALAAAVKTCYFCCPCRRLLDRWWARSPQLQRVFNQGLVEAYKYRGYKYGGKQRVQPPHQYNKVLGVDSGFESAPREGARHDAAGEPGTTPALIRAAGFDCESHSVRTEDGFWLVLFRIVPRRRWRRRNTGNDDDDDNDDDDNDDDDNDDDDNDDDNDDDDDDDDKEDDEQSGGLGAGPAVLFMHGLMLSSDSFLATGARSLPIALARAGYDVWLGNNRGNRYSHKHDRLAPDCDAYWDYCLDELARYDVPALVDYVLCICSSGQKTPAVSKLAYCGFSNGTAQGFAALALHPGLSQRIGCFIALSPAVAVNSIQESLVRSLIESRLHMIYVLFGRRHMLGITSTAQRLLSPEFFAWSMDKAVRFLFGWRMEHINQEEKARVYQHTYSYSSVKQVVHWFQMIQSGSPGLKMWDTNVTPSRHAHRKPPVYDTRRISTEDCKIHCWVGTKDTLVDAGGLVDVLPEGATVTHVEGLTHLEMMWAEGLDEGVFREVEARIREAFA